MDHCDIDDCEATSDNAGQPPGDAIPHRKLCVMVGHRPTNDQRSWRTDLINHGPTHRRMGYPLSRPHHVPIGSGTIERTLRRVINRRVRSNGAGWLRENAESVIRIRTRIKAGRTEE